MTDSAGRDDSSATVGPEATPNEYHTWETVDPCIGRRSHLG